MSDVLGWAAVKANLCSHSGLKRCNAFKFIQTCHQSVFQLQQHGIIISNFINITFNRVLSNSLATILANPSHWQQYATWDGTNDRSSSGNDKISLSKIIESVLKTTWTLDAFQNPVLIQTLCQLNCFDKTNMKCLSAYEMLLKRRSRLVYHRSFSYRNSL